MSNTPPPVRESSLSAVWFVLGGLVVLAVLYFAFFAGGPARAPTTGNSVTVETPAAAPAAPAPEAATPPAAATPPSAEPAPATPATPAPAAPAPAN